GHRQVRAQGRLRPRISRSRLEGARGHRARLDGVRAKVLAPASRARRRPAGAHLRYGCADRPERRGPRGEEEFMTTTQGPPLRRLLRDVRGGTDFIEYLVLIGVFAVGGWAGFRFLSSSIAAKAKDHAV